ncbi:MAG: NAD(P)/FAD-dependent oxidoreductase [Caldimonas sp.]
MPKRYDLLVIGSGTAAVGAATRMREAGWTVAVVDFRPYGGTCALRGCDPKKMLIAGAEAVDHVRRMQNKGVIGNSKIDWPQLMAFKRAFTDPVPQRMEHTLAEKGIDTYHERARFTGPNTVQLEGGQALEAKFVLLAVGAEPVTLNIPGEEHLVTNEGFLSLESLPARIALVGGGYIAAEFSHIAARAGASVTVLQHADRMLTQFDPDVVGWLMETFQRLRIDVRTATKVTAIEKTAHEFRVYATSAGVDITVDADLVVHAAGRAPDFGPLDLVAAEVATTHGRLELNGFLQSISNPAIYAAGDAAQAGPPLTPVASHDAKVVVANLLDGNHQRPNYDGVPSVAFTIPPIARVGLTDVRARERGLKFRMNSKKASNWFTAQQAAEPVYGFKVLVDEDSDRILGAHLVGPKVDEVINIFALAIRHGLTAKDLRATMFAYPTGASVIGYML